MGRKLDQNILKIQTDDKNKHGKELIECNFDSELFGYMIELDRFQELQSFGVTIQGNKEDEFII